VTESLLPRHPHRISADGDDEAARCGRRLAKFDVIADLKRVHGVLRARKSTQGSGASSIVSRRSILPTVKVFISWSGSRSHQIALALRDWLPTVLPAAAPWVSSEDIPKGARWTFELGRELDAAKFGIICLVPENLHEDWVIFEAGAMSRSIDAARVAPLLRDVAIKDVPGPLAQFQCTVFEKEDVRRLVRSVNQTSEAPIDPKLLDAAFDRHWPDLARVIQGIEGTRRQAVPAKALVASPAAPHEDLFKEPGGLPREQTAILTTLAKNPDVEPTTTMMAPAIGENQTRTQYHLDRLRERRLIDYSLVVGEPATYYLTGVGRAYVVENNLI